MTADIASHFHSSSILSAQSLWEDLLDQQQKLWYQQTGLADCLLVPSSFLTFLTASLAVASKNTRSMIAAFAKPTAEQVGLFCQGSGVTATESRSEKGL